MSSKRAKPSESMREKPYKFTLKAREKFLRTLEDLGRVGLACRAAGISHTTAYWYKKNDEGFAAAWEDALRTHADNVEAEVYRRAVKGWDEPLYFQGQLTGDVVRKYSDPLLIHYSKRIRPDAYRERQHVETHVTGSVATQDLDRMTPQQREKRIRELEEKRKRALSADPSAHDSSDG